MTASPCQICGGTTRAPLAGKNGCTVVRCADCGFAFMDPLPSADDSARLYDDVYEDATTGYFAKAEKKLRRARRRARRLARLARTAGSRPRFLDVGASGGFMAEAAREAGFDATGVELDARSVAYARETFPRNTFVHGTVEEFARDNAGAQFDVVYSSEVIEHVPDANQFMAAIATLLKPGGHLYLTTPDVGHWRRPRDLARWEAFDPPAHCLYFDRRTLARLLARHGFAIVKRQPALKPGLKILAAKDR